MARIACAGIVCGRRRGRLTRTRNSDEEAILRASGPSNSLQDACARGYLKPADFDGVAGKMVATVVKDERITGKGCAG
jgi:hypothetical protein